MQVDLSKNTRVSDSALKFRETLEFGKVAETAIANWLMNRGCNILPAYEIVDSKFQGPRLFCKEGNLVTPDLLIFKEAKILWIEAKHKTAFTWHRKTSRFVTGVDYHHWLDYLKVKQRTGLECWILFNHLGGKAKDSPESPSGLFGGEVGVLEKNINHTHENWGKSGMVYWAHERLKRFCDAL